VEVSGKLHASAASLPKIRRVGPRTGLDDVERRKILLLPGLELRSLGITARSQSLHRLCYIGSPEQFVCKRNSVLYIYIYICVLFSYEICAICINMSLWQSGVSKRDPQQIAAELAMGLAAIRRSLHIFENKFPLVIAYIISEMAISVN
jgi:hypothetical protein